jgi:hypothetical protein
MAIHRAAAWPRIASLRPPPGDIEASPPAAAPLPSPAAVMLAAPRGVPRDSDPLRRKGELEGRIMYLVHVHVLPWSPDDELPSSKAEIVAEIFHGRHGLEHVSVHADARPYPVIGLYVRAASLRDAEETAAAMWRHVSATHPRLCDWTFVRAEVPLLRPGVENGPWVD